MLVLTVLIATEEPDADTAILPAALGLILLAAGGLALVYVTIRAVRRRIERRSRKLT